MSSATFTIVVSSTDMIAPRITTIAIRRTCGSMRLGPAVAVVLVMGSWIGREEINL